ncbi:MAG: T9SS type A sorting domain-containing protein [Saprospiraceae bacterium]
MSFKHHLFNINRWFLCIAILLSLTADISSQAISNVHHFYANGALQDVHHFYDGTYTYSFYAVNSDTFFYEDQLALPLKNKENDIILLKLDEDGKVVKYTVFRSEVPENGLGSVRTSITKLTATIRGGEIFFNISVGGYLYKDDVKIEANYSHIDPNPFGNTNHFILGLDENLDIIFQKNINRLPSNPNVQQVAIQGDILYILGSFHRYESMHIEGDSVYRPNSILLAKSYLYAYDVAQDTLVTKTCFSAGGSSNTIKPIIFDKEGNLYTALGHDQDRLWLDGVYLLGNFLGANSVIIKFSPMGKVLDHYNMFVKNNCFVSQLVLNTNDEVIVFGGAVINNKDSIAYIGQNGKTPINTQKNWASFIFKLDKNLETEWYNLFSAPSEFRTSFQDVFIDDTDNMYFTFYNEKGFLITDLKGHEFEQGFHFCKLNQKGEIVVHNKAGDLLDFYFFYSMQLKEANVLTINARLRGDIKNKEALFGLTFIRKMDGVIFDFDIRETLSSTVEKTIDNNIQSKIFPNPIQAGDHLIVGGDRYRDGRYEIYSIQGVPVVKGTMTGSNIPTSAHIESGIYILRVSRGALSFNRLITFF